MNTYAQNQIEFESKAYQINKPTLLYIMGSSTIVDTDYGAGEDRVLDYLGIDKIFCNGGHRKTASLRIRRNDWGNITLRGHINDPYSQTNKIYSIIANNDSYADYTIQINGIDTITNKANGTIVRLYNRLLSAMLVRMHRDNVLNQYWVDKGDNTRFYDFSYSTLQQYSVFPSVAKVTDNGLVQVEL